MCIIRNIVLSCILESKKIQTKHIVLAISKSSSSVIGIASHLFDPSAKVSKGNFDFFFPKMNKIYNAELFGRPE